MATDALATSQWDLSLLLLEFKQHLSQINVEDFRRFLSLFRRYFLDWGNE
jgi:hypothetical protein